MSSRSGSAPARRNSSIVPPACSDSEHQPSRVGRSCDGRHHARRLPFEQRTEAAEVGGRELDIRARAKQRPLERAEEAGQVMDAGPREQLRADREQCAVDAQIGPVLALAERAQKRGRLARTERYAQRVCRCRVARRLPRQSVPQAFAPDLNGIAANVSRTLRSNTSDCYGPAVKPLTFDGASWR